MRRSTTDTDRTIAAGMELLFLMHMCEYAQAHAPSLHEGMLDLVMLPHTLRDAPRQFPVRLPFRLESDGNGHVDRTRYMKIKFSAPQLIGRYDVRGAYGAATRGTLRFPEFLERLAGWGIVCDPIGSRPTVMTVYCPVNEALAERMRESLPPLYLKLLTESQQSPFSLRTVLRHQPLLTSLEPFSPPEGVTVERYGHAQRSASDEAPVSDREAGAWRARKGTEHRRDLPGTSR